MKMEATGSKVELLASTAKAHSVHAAHNGVANKVM